MLRNLGYEVFVTLIKLYFLKCVNFVESDYISTDFIIKSKF
jgi:hypothetical protein